MIGADPVWDELGKIDYLLDQLARAVERSEVDRAVYEQLAPRYLERRGELAAILSARAARTTRAQSYEQPLPRYREPAPRMPAVPVPVAPASAPVASTPPPGPVAPTWAPPAPGDVVPEPDDFLNGDLFPPAPVARIQAHPPVVPRTPPVRTPPVRRPPRPPVSAGVWMTYTGAFLVIVAVAIFTIYAWSSMSAILKLGVLVAVTATFYAAGEFMRTKMGLPAVGVALVGVGSAMLLFDSWALINGFGLSGFLPWAVALLVCSLIYWATELRIAGGWFGAIGAAAQVGWWWLLGQALHLPSEWQIAGIALVALVWSLGASRASEDGPLAALGVVLRYGSAALAAGMTLAILPETVGVLHAGTVSIVAAAVVTAIASNIVVERFDARVRSWTALLHLPVLFALLGTPASATVAIVCAAMAVGYGAYALVRGGAEFATIAFAVGALGLWRAAGVVAWDQKFTVGAMASFFALAVLGGDALARIPSPGGAGVDSPRARAGQIWHVLGLLALGAATLFGVTLMPGGLPMLRATVTSGQVALASWVFVLWILICARTRDQTAGWAVFAWSFYVLAAGSSWLLPHLHSAWYATALLVLAAGWLLADGVASRALSVDRATLAGFSRCALIFVTVLGMALSAVLFTLGSVPAFVLLATAVAAWSADALRSREWPASLGLVATVLVLIPLLVGGMPLFSVHATPSVVVLAAWAMLVVAVVGVRNRDAIVGWTTFAWSFYLAASLLSWAAPGLNSAFYAMALLLVAVAWQQADPAAGRVLGIDPGVIALVCRGLFVIIGMGGLAASSVLFRGDPVPAFMLVGLLAAAWAADAARTREPLAVAGLCFTALLVPLVGGGVPLAMHRITLEHAALASWVLLMLGLVCARTRNAVAGWMTFAWSFYTIAAIVSWRMFDLHSAWYATALLVTAVAWQQAEPAASRALGVAREPFANACRVIFAAVTLVGLGASAYFFRLDSVPACVLVAAAIAAWAADSWRTRERIAAAALAVTSFVFVPLVSGGLPLTGTPVTLVQVALVSWGMAAFVLTSARTRDVATGWATFAWSFYLVAALGAWAAPAVHTAWYVFALLAVSVAWMQAGRLASRALGLDRRVLTSVCRALALSIPVLGLMAVQLASPPRAYPVAAVFALAALAWAADAVRSKEWWTLAPAAAFGVACAFVAGWTAFDASTGGQIAVALGTALAAVACFGPRTRSGWGAVLSISAALSASVAAIAVGPHTGPMTVVLGLLTVAWALAAFASDQPLVLGLAGILASLTLGAGLLWKDPSPFVALFAYPALGALLFVPAAAYLGRDGGFMQRAARPLAAAALVATAQLAVIGALESLLGHRGIGVTAFQVGEIGLGIGLLATGAVVVLWSGLERQEEMSYAGYATVLLGIFAFMDYGRVRQAEFYLVAVAAYALAMGVLYVRTSPGRKMPIASDALAFACAVLAPFLLSLQPLQTPGLALQHGLWTLGLSTVAIAAGLLSKTRLHFLGGIAVAVVEALWLSRTVLLALPAWVWIGLAGLGLITGGAVFARRELLDTASRRVSEGFADWR